MPAGRYTADVFVNCPFDSQYQPMFEAIVFCAMDCGIRPRCALEVEDSAQVRIDKIFSIIADCRFGIHDISRTELEPDANLPRFNMPLELGIFLGAKRFGSSKQRQKACLVLDIERYRYQRFISDIAGQDVQSHAGDPRRAILVVRNWLRNVTGRSSLPGGAEINRRYLQFHEHLPTMCRDLRLDVDELTFTDLTYLVAAWLEWSDAFWSTGGGRSAGEK
jgi:hypothetical protein